MNYLILGANGMAGHTITLYLLEFGHNVTALTRTPFSFCSNIIGDVMDFNFLSKIKFENFDFIINCIGILNNNCCSNIGKAIYVNSFLPHHLAELIKNSKTKVIQLSTDCVFSGKHGHYNETDEPDGTTLYDKTKALGEINDRKNLTFRNSIIGPDINAEGMGLFNWFMRQNVNTLGYTNVIWTGVTTLTLAKAIEEVSRQDISGIYNLVNNTVISKFELLGLINKYFKSNAISIIPDDKIKIDKSLVNTRKDFDFIVPSYEIMIEEMLDWVKYKKNLYNHYTLQ